MNDPRKIAIKTPVPAAAKAPPKAARDTVQPDSAPKAQHTVTARPAPALTPMMPGEASLLPRTLCRIQPAAAKAPPERIQARVLGSREYQKN